MWLAYFSGPLAWTAHELLSYALVRLVCGTGLGILQAVVSIAALALAAAGTFVAVRVYGARVRAPRSGMEFVAATAILGDGLFVFAIAMEAIPELVVSPCL
jgi:hypothetical protein